MCYVKLKNELVATYNVPRTGCWFLAAAAWQCQLCQVFVWKGWRLETMKVGGGGAFTHPCAPPPTSRPPPLPLSVYDSIKLHVPDMQSGSLSQRQLGEGRGGVTEKNFTRKQFRGQEWRRLRWVDPLALKIFSFCWLNDCLDWHLNLIPK